MFKILKICITPEGGITDTGLAQIHFRNLDERNRQLKTPGFFSCSNSTGKDLHPWNPSMSLPSLIKWARKLLSSDSVKYSFPNQAAPLDLISGIKPGQTVKRKDGATRQMYERVQNSRGLRGYDLAPSQRRVLQGKLQIDGVELRLQKGKWEFSSREIPLSTAVKFAVHIIRDEAVRESWEIYHVPWLVTDHELTTHEREGQLFMDGESEVVPIPTNAALDTIFLSRDLSYALTRCDSGFQIVMVDYEEEIDGQFHYYGNKQASPRFSTWSNLVDFATAIYLDPMCEELRDLPDLNGIATGDKGFRDWLCTGNEPCRDSMRKRRNTITSSIGEGPKGSLGKRLDENPDGVSVFDLASGETVVIRVTEGEIDLCTSSRGNPTLSKEDLFKLLLVLIGDERTFTERPNIFVPFALNLYHARYGGRVAEDTRPELIGAPASTSSSVEVRVVVVAPIEDRVQYLDDHSNPFLPVVLGGKGTTQYDPEVIAQLTKPETDTGELWRDFSQAAVELVQNNLNRLFPEN